MAAAASSSDTSTIILIWMMIMVMSVEGANTIVGSASWCVARSDASEEALQTALDYACGAGADCAPLLSSGLCFLPNTIQAHASYAFNSFFQRKLMAPGTCDFAGSATVAKTDPSYGSCVYPASPSTAGGTTTSTTPTTPTISTPTTPASPLFDNGGTGGVSPGLNPAGFGTPSITDNSKASLEFPMTPILMTTFSFFFSLSLINYS